MEPGDAIVWDRWAFHRSVPFKPTTATNTNTDTTDSDSDSVSDSTAADSASDSATASAGLKLRYSIRYIPSTARAAAAGLYTGLHESVAVGQPFISPHHPQVSWGVYTLHSATEVRHIVLLNYTT
jgi:hypothetical protein